MHTYKPKTVLLTKKMANLGLSRRGQFEGKDGPANARDRHRPLVWTLGEVFLARLVARGRLSASALALN